VIDQLNRHAIQVLRQAGHTLDQIVTLVAVGKRTLQRVSDEPMITGIDIACDRLVGRRAGA
jgi:type IV secretory pathway ATPase VirB11/archaellum biosynthesis ATPase